VLEVAGQPGSGRRVVVFDLLEELLAGGSGVYVDLAGSLRRAVASGRVRPGEGVWARLSVYREASAGELASLALSGSASVLVLDSLPRLVYGVEAGRRERWGCAAAVLSAMLAGARSGLCSIVVNYASGGRSFGDAVFSHYFTHRLLVERVGAGVVARLVYPLPLELQWR